MTTSPKPIDFDPSEILAANSYAMRVIRYRAACLVHQKGVPKQEQEDVEQELTLRLLKRLRNYDPARSKLTTFISSSVRYDAQDVLRERYADKHIKQRATRSLDVEVGMRGGQHPGKQDCLILDFAGNIERHGPIDQIRVKEKTGDGSGPAPAKECPECRSIVAAGYATCPDCGFAFPPPERQEHDAEASTSSVLSGKVTKTVHDVQDVTYYVHTKRGGGEDAPKTMRVEYQVGLNAFVSEWVCFEHHGYARRKAEAWWRQRSPDPIPATAERAVELAEADALAATLTITLRSVSDEPYDRIVEYELGELPEAVGIDICDSFGGLEEIPF